MRAPCLVCDAVICKYLAPAVIMDDPLTAGCSTGDSLMPKPVMVSSSHTAKYPDPINVSAGDRLTLPGDFEIWDGYRWLWAVAPDGKSGWIPDTLVAGSDRAPIAGADYSALELSCAVGEQLEVMSEHHGWAWCRNAAGKEGWVPLRSVKAK